MCSAALLIHLYLIMSCCFVDPRFCILALFLVYFAESNEVNFTRCDGNWHYLVLSKKCIRISYLPLLSYPDAFRKCLPEETKVADSRLSDLNSWSESDLTGKYMSSYIDGFTAWTNSIDRTPNYTFLEIQGNATLNRIDFNKTRNETYFCEASPVDGVLDLMHYQKTSSSNFTPPNTLGLLRHETKFIALNTVFTRGLFYGKGWCSQSASKTEFVEIDFKRSDVLLKGIVMQDGVINKCMYWVHTFYIEYYRFGYWKNVTEGDTVKIYNFNGTLTEYWFKESLLLSLIRIRPLSMNSSCTNHFDVFCLRIELRGKFNSFDDNYYFIKRLQRKLQSKLSKERNIRTNVTHLGNYALPKPITGCPNSEALVGCGYYLKSLGINVLSMPVYLSGSFSNHSESFKIDVCIYDSNKSGMTFHTGEYCIFKYDNPCPDGFETVVSKGYDILESNSTKEQVLSETTFKVKNSSKNQIFCCQSNSSTFHKNDTAERCNKTTTVFRYTRPFYLFPSGKNKVCPLICGTVSEMQYISLNCNRSDDPCQKQTDIMSIWDGLYKEYSKANGQLRLFLCYYKPENNADKIILTPKGPPILNMNSYFQFDVSIRSQGLKVDYGVDAALNYTMQMEPNCPATETIFRLVNGSGSFIGKPCSKGSTTFTVTMKTTKGLPLTANTTVEFISTYNVVIVLSNKLKGICIDITSTKSYPSLNISCFHDMYDVFYQYPNMFTSSQSDPNTVHHIVVIEEQNYMDIMLAIGKRLNIPVYVFDLYSSVFKMNSEHNERYLHSPAMNKFRVFLSRKEMKSSVGIVVYRMPGRVTLAEYYAIFQSGIPLLKDVIIGSKGIVNAADVQALKNYPNCSVFLFLDSIGSSNLLRKAIDLNVTPLQGYRWFSFSPNFVISNTFLKKPCYQSTPPCHTAFQSMMHIFHNTTLGECPLLPIVTKLLSNNVNNVSAFVHSGLASVAAHEMVHAINRNLNHQLNKKQIPTLENILKFTDQMPCTPSGSGFRLLPRTSRAETEMVKNVTFMCQPGWSGSGCNIPFCTNTSCNTTHGSCIAPQLCYCHVNWYGPSCTKDCKLTCLNNGICKDGYFGDGTCKKCDRIYYKGKDCNDMSPVYSVVASVIGTFCILVVFALYIYKIIKFRETHDYMKKEERDEEYMMSWDDFESMNEVVFSTKETKELLNKKMEYTSYKKAMTYGGNHLFVKCYNKPVTLTSEIKSDLKKVKKLNHDNISSMVGLIFKDDNVAVVTNVASMGSLFDVINQEHIPITWDVKYSILQDISRGMIYLHQEVGIEHGSLKSPNCLIHQGWLVKLTDIGLKKLKFKRKRRTTNVNFADMNTPTLDVKKRNKTLYQDESVADADYASLLWTAPEILSTGITNLDHLLEITHEAETYSLGIIIAELINGHPPFKECTVMSTSHIVQAIGHIIEPIASLGQLMNNNYDGEPANNRVITENNFLRPVVNESLLPTDELEKNIITILMESCWSEKPSERPCFEYILQILEGISPLKGSQTAKRALLLQRETESLEEYISHDTQQLFQENEKYADLLSKVIPPIIASEINKGDGVSPKYHESVTLMHLRVVNISEIIRAASPSEAIEVLHYVLKSLHSIISHKKFHITEISEMLAGDSYLIGSGFPYRNDERHAHEIATIATNAVSAIHSFKLSSSPSLKVQVNVGIHSGPVITGIVYRSSTPTYVVCGETVDIVNKLQIESLPFGVHASKPTVKLLSYFDFEIIGRSSFQVRINNTLQKTYWVRKKYSA